eukprot:477025_1
MSYKETNLLLNDTNYTSNNYQTYSDDRETSPMNINILQQTPAKDDYKQSPQYPVQRPKRNSCKVCTGRILTRCEPNLKWLKRTYYVILCNAVIACVLLIVSRVFSYASTAQTNLFHSNIFMSDSPPLLLTANIVMMISYSLENFLALRVCLAIGCTCFAFWGLTNDPLLLDTAMFNTVMMLLNVHHAVILAYHHRHIEFEACWEQIYVEVFEGYLNRVNFNKLVDISYQRKLKKGEIFKKKEDEITSLCCLTSGRIKVVREHEKMYAPKRKDSSGQLLKIEGDIGYFLRDPHFVNLCHKNHFIEAPQWVHANLKPRGHRFSVSFVAVDDCEYIKWPKENLIDLIEQNPDIYHALSGVLGLHTAYALLKSREYTKIQHRMTQGSSRKLTDNENIDCRKDSNNAD